MIKKLASLQSSVFFLAKMSSMIGKKYNVFKPVLTIKTKITKYCFCKTATENICILPKKADVGGKPIIASAPMQNAIAVIG